MQRGPQWLPLGAALVATVVFNTQPQTRRTSFQCDAANKQKIKKKMFCFGTTGCVSVARWLTKIVILKATGFD